MSMELYREAGDGVNLPRGVPPGKIPHLYNCHPQHIQCTVYE